MGYSPFLLEGTLQQEHLSGPKRLYNYKFIPLCLLHGVAVSCNGPVGSGCG